VLLYDPYDTFTFQQSFLENLYSAAQPPTTLHTTKPTISRIATMTAEVNIGPLPPALRAVSISLN
jgi:hypothetical protein